MSRRDLERLRTDADRRSKWVEEDPSKLFRLLALDDPSPEERAEFDRRLTIVLSESQPEVPAEISARLPPSRPVATWGRFAAVAALLLVVIWIGSSLLPIGQPDAPVSTVAEANPPVDFADPALETVQPAGIREAAFQEGSVYGIEVLATPGDARVVDLSVGQTRVVMIFDKELDL